MNASASRQPCAPGFSLLELSVVMSIIVILIALAVPAASSLLGGREMTRAVSEISTLVETARGQAMTTQSLVWLCFEQKVDAAGSDELRAVLLSPVGGSPTTSSRAGKVLVTQTGAESVIYRWPHLKLVALSALPEVRALVPPETVSTALATQRVQGFVYSAKETTGNFQTLTFTPQGYAMLTTLPKITTPYVRMIDLGLQPTRQGVPIKRLGCALLLNGFNGRIQVLRR